MTRHSFLYPILLIFLLTTTVQLRAQAPVKDYAKEWKKVDDLVSKGLPKSALTEVKKIYDLAQKEDQDAQVIKSLVYMTQLQSENRENNEVLSIAEIEKETGNNKEP